MMGFWLHQFLQANHIDCPYCGNWVDYAPNDRCPHCRGKLLLAVSGGKAYQWPSGLLVMCATATASFGLISIFMAAFWSVAPPVPPVHFRVPRIVLIAMLLLEPLIIILAAMMTRRVFKRSGYARPLMMAGFWLVLLVTWMLGLSIFLA